MSLETARQGYIGLAIEATAGTAEGSPDTYIPFTENSLTEKHEPVQINDARASRVMNHDAVTGKKWGEGDIGLYVDTNNIGYMLKLALGQEANTNVSGAVYDHLFYPTVSGNNAASATMWIYRGDDPGVKRYTYSTVDTFELEVANEDEPAMISCSMITGHPTEQTAPTLTTVSGTVMTFKDMTVKFGTNYANALAATATKVTSLSLQIANNVEPLYRSGSNEPDTFVYGDLEVTGEYTLFFENDTELDIYRNLDKRCMVIDFVGAGLPGSLTERLRIVVRRMFIEDHSQEADLGEIMAITQSFRAIQGTPLDPGFFEATVRNAKSTTY